jgi:hypothetical protein
MFKRTRQVMVGFALAVLVLVAGGEHHRPDPLDLAIAPYRYSQVRWTLGHLPDKWVNKLADSLPWASRQDREERVAQAQEFFNLGQQLRALERRLQVSITSGPHAEAQAARRETGQVQQQRLKLQPGVEEAIESEIGAVLAQEGLTFWAGLTFPPVDAVFAGSPHVLVSSPRHRIERQQTILLLPKITNEEKERIEALVLQKQNLSALVEGTGGVATYPSVVSDSGTLRDALVAVAHEWLHHWFFFRPLGQSFWSSSDMMTLNETAATLASREIGHRALQGMTAQTGNQEPVPVIADNPNSFDFNAEMRQTRSRVEELLAQGRIEGAEAYMEERRQFIVAQGYLIRKINQAFFAFHGTYATSPASISPIAGQLQELRARSKSLGDFLRTVARFGSYQEFLDYLAATETVPAPAGR